MATPLVLMGIVGAATLGGVLAPIDDALRDARFSLLQRPASGTITLVEIDAASLHVLDDWPWSRDRYARVLENLRAAGASVVGFDVDFSAQSSPEPDARFAAAIARHADHVVLPTFAQKNRTGRSGAQLIETAPRPELAGDAALATVNLVPERDGRLRRGLYGLDVGTGYRPSMGSALANGPYGATQAFHIDFGIDPQSLDRLSFVDVYNGNFDSGLVRGRRILIGATAVELGDEFAIPLYGILPGVVLHALEYESMVQGRALWGTPLWVSLLIAWAIVFLRARRLKRWSWRAALGPSGLIVLSALAAPLGVQALWPVTLDVAPILLAEGLCLTLLLLNEMKRRAEEIVEQREILLRHQATHDSETELPNRRALLAEIVARDPDHGFVVMALGVDRLSAIRGAIGYGQSNYLMLQIATRLRDIVVDASIARLSTSILGIASKLERGQDPLVWAEGVLGKLGAFATMDGLSIDLGFKLGVAEYGSASPTPELLLEHSSVALDTARGHRRDVVVFTPELVDAPIQRLSLMSDLTRAMENGELSLAYQPKQSLRSGALSGAEALLRWTHPDRGVVAPDFFVSVAEETGHIRALTEWVLKRVIVDAPILTPDAALPISVNLSARLLGQEECVRRLIDLALSAPLPIVFEITETAVIEHPEAAFRSIERILAAELRISIDDYGVGLSALSYLKSIPAQELKLDKSFVQSLESNARDRLLTKSTIDLAHSLDMEVVAEGVETETARLILQTMGCDHIQGYLLAPALPVGELAQLVRAKKDALKTRTSSVVEAGALFDKRFA